MKWKSSALLLWVLAAFLFAFAFQGSRHLWDPDEGRYSAVALNMTRTGDWIVPRLHDEHPHFTKPPLTYWLLAGSIQVLGKNEWAVRAPISLAFLATLWLLFLAGRSFLPARPWLPPLVYGLSLLPFGAANLVTTDTFLSLWEALAGLSFFWWRGGSKEGGGKKYLLLFWFSLGLAFLTKGPPGLMPLLGALLFLWIREGVSSSLSLFHPLGLLLFGLVGLGWFVLVVLRVPHLLDYLLEKEFLGRIFSGMHHRNSQWYGSFLVYLPTLLLGTLPWTWLLLRKAGSAPALFRSSFWRKRKEDDPWGLFFLLWFLLPLPLFFLARSRLPLYLLPLFVPLSLLLAREASPWFAGKTGKKGRSWLGPASWALLLLLAKGIVPFFSYKGDPVPLAGAIRAAAGPGVKEIVFVDTKARYGLSFYTGAEVERVDFGPLPGPAPLLGQAQTLLQELAEDEPGRIFLLRSGDREKFLARLASRGYRALPKGGFGDYKFFLVGKRRG